MNPIIWFSIIGTSTLIVFLPCIISHKARKKQEHQQPEFEPFVVSEYYARMEKATLDILEVQEPVDQTIILWWGLDGLRLDEDGNLKWISRKKTKPVDQSVFYQPCQTIAPLPFGAAQSTRATIDQLAGLKMQSEIMNFNMALQNQIQGFNSALQSYVMQSPGYYARLTDCCCNRLIQR